MASRFEDMLEHREVIVYRAPRRWIPKSAGLTFIGFAAPIAVAAGSGLLRFDPIGLASLAAALSGALIITLYYTLREASREAVVTDRRLLQRTGWRRPVTTEVRIKDICRIQVSWDRLRLTRRDGRCLGLGHPRYARDLGVALAHAALLPLPRPTPGREAFVLLRPFLTRDQMRAWMENSELSWPLADGKPADDEQDDWSWRLIDLLYGRRPAAGSGSA